MVTNKERALDYLINNSKNHKDNNLHEGCEYISLQKAQKVIEIASKPDWYYPEKGEFPKLNEWLIIVEKDNEVLPVHYRNGNKQAIDTCFEENFYKAWTYLPKFEENE